MPSTLAPTASISRRGAPRSTCASGAWTGAAGFAGEADLARSACACFSARKSGDSLTLSRITKPTTSSTAENRNGTRQPQLRNASSSRPVTSLNISIDRISPAGLPNCAKDAKKVRLLLSGECSPAISTAPPHSPPTAIPCTIRSRINRTGAQKPMDA
ncbi:hypothetical protein D3C72_1941910 [compost metagenome]